jgi:hypothetical protein
MQPARNLDPACEPPIGTVLSRRYQLVTKLYVDGEARFRARDLLHSGQDVELVITGFNGWRYNFHIKSRSAHAQRPALYSVSESPLPGNDRALSDFSNRVLLTGVSILQGERVVFSGYNRQTRRPVRVVIEEIE